MISKYQAKYYALELSVSGNNDIKRISQSLFNSTVDLNPHQIEASLFALRSPLSMGVILADEVGLGKTIEAGLIVCQYWAEKKRKILIITPASLRKQWEIELLEKFNIKAFILDSKTYNNDYKDSYSPFDIGSIVITSYNFAAANSIEIKSVNWDLVIIDEAHKLRNSYRPKNKIGQSLKYALEDKKKILLTATPLQNSLLELYGLTHLIDEKIFGDVPSFRTQYMNAGADLVDLRNRIKTYCKRTLRKDVLEYINYTQRNLITRPFDPSEPEQNLYNEVSKYLQNSDNYALPSRQRHLITLIVRKVLASSPYALISTLEMMRNRLILLLEEAVNNINIMKKIQFDDDYSDELLEELLISDDNPEYFEAEPAEMQEIDLDIPKLNAEIQKLGDFIAWAGSIGVDTKAKALLKALEIGFEKILENGALQKVVIFTESVRTQMFLKQYLESNGYFGQVSTFNGSNSDKESSEIYRKWLEVNKPIGRSSGSKQVDLRTAIIEDFRDNAKIMIGTEAAAEGLNLQFCSLVVNYDLPWNPQRIEQRIGRCHRYGQKHDVVVINFLNQKNYADQRVYELLKSKFELFDGVFGASDEIIGSVESGMNFEKRILEIYQLCRTPQEIQMAFDQLQEELKEQIERRMDDTRRNILEHFDYDVHERLKINLQNAKIYIDNISNMFWKLSKYMLMNFAEFDDYNYNFRLFDSPNETIKTGTYKLISQSSDNIPSDYLYRMNHPLGEYTIDNAKILDVGIEEVEFDITNHPVKISSVNLMKGKSGWLTLQKLDVQSFDKEEYLVFSGMDEEGNSIDQEFCEKLFQCDSKAITNIILPNDIENRLNSEAKRHADAIINKSLENNNRHFNEVREQLDKWAEDMEVAAQKELDDTKKKIKALNREARNAETLDQQSKIQMEIAELEKLKLKQRREIFAIEDQIAEKRNNFIDKLKLRLLQKSEINTIFVVRWRVV